MSSNSKKTGVLVVNLGTPDSPQTKDVKKYLGEFLMDPLVIDLPYWQRFLLVKGLILNFRPKKSAEAYQEIWSEEGSPLLVHSEKFTSLLKNEITDIPIELAMNYGRPSLDSGLKRLKDEDVDSVLVFQMYPHRALSSTESVKTRLDTAAKSYPNMKIEYLPVFYDDPKYIAALTQSIETSYNQHPHDHLLFSFHGIPEHHISKEFPKCIGCFKTDCPAFKDRYKDCYRSQCYFTADTVAKGMKLQKSQYSVAFQSRLGRKKWIDPYTDIYIDELLKKGVKNLAVACPSFTADCLETLEEIGIRLQEDFIKKGGNSLNLLPCLNEDSNWVKAAATFIQARL